MGQKVLLALIQRFEKLIPKHSNQVFNIFLFCDKEIVFDKKLSMVMTETKYKLKENSARLI